MYEMIVDAVKENLPQVQDFIDLFHAIPDIDSGLAASVFHFGEIRIPDLKQTLRENNINVRLGL